MVATQSKFLRLGPVAFLIWNRREFFPGAVVNASGVFTQMRWRFYIYRRLPSLVMPVIMHLLSRKP